MRCSPPNALQRTAVWLQSNALVARVAELGSFANNSSMRIERFIRLINRPVTYAS